MKELLEKYKKHSKALRDKREKNETQIAALTAEVEKLKGLLENVEKHVVVWRLEEALMKKKNAAVSEMDQEINKAKHESVATLQVVYCETCTVQVSKRSRRNRNTANKRAREAAAAVGAANE